MERNFDQIIERKNTNSVKYDCAAECGKPEGLIPMWVADMDFQAPRGVSERLEQVSKLGIFGYSTEGPGYFAAVRSWYEKHFNWQVDRRWLVKTPGVVFAAAMAVRALTEEGDGVLIQQPVYYPFGEVIEANGRRVVSSPLVLRDGIYKMDLQDFEQKILQRQVKLFILCSPHNPVGRVWTGEELEAVGEICLRHGVFVVSDEIHGDFTFKGHCHHVFADISPQFRDNSIICTSPSKTFNLAGLQVSNLFIANKKVRHRIKAEIQKTGYGNISLMGLAACQAAYETGETWLQDLKTYLAGNLDYLREYVNTRLPGIELIEPQGTYLIWLDLRKLGLSQDEQERFVTRDAGLWLDSGIMFGPEGEGFERMNIACPRDTLKKALNQLEQALRSSRKVIKEK